MDQNHLMCDIFIAMYLESLRYYIIHLKNPGLNISFECYDVTKMLKFADNDRF